MLRSSIVLGLLLLAVAIATVSDRGPRGAAQLEGDAARVEGATAAWVEVGPTQTPLTSGLDLKLTLEYLAECRPSELGPAGSRAYRLIEQLTADDRLTGEEGALAFDARGVLMDEDSCWPDGRPKLTPLVNDYSYPPPGS